MRTVVKLGGSLIRHSASIISALEEYFGTCGQGDDHSILIVPGGGVFANSVRDISEKCSIGDDAAHWMAILSMEQYAYFLIDKTGINSVENIHEFPAGVSVLMPYKMLKETDRLPHSWNVTSDTIGAWIAKETGSRFVKVTDVDGVIADDIIQKWMTALELSRMGVTCIDSSLPGFLMENMMDCVVVNGMYPERVIDAVIGKNVIGTHIKGNI
ncbi:amino acid kinase [Methanolobus sediminis]|uniref:Amino acid kinase n=1 Tax=Methanolobus sediminis TaxID=3072978 RepID=A0AA51UIY5_9EURY|nr:amino acid kinase [Methanolobus sediminis]WMW24443.1 amino acid kinase [Methanolobus sediminis]